MGEDAPGTRPNDEPTLRMGQRVRHVNSGREGRVTAIVEEPTRQADHYRYTVEWDAGGPADREMADIEGDSLEPI